MNYSKSLKAGAGIFQAEWNIMTRFGKIQCKIAKPPGTALKGERNRRSPAPPEQKISSIWQGNGSWAPRQLLGRWKRLVDTSWRSGVRAHGEEEEQEGLGKRPFRLSPGAGSQACSKCCVRELVLVPEPERRTKTPPAPPPTSSQQHQDTKFCLKKETIPNPRLCG